MAAPAAVAAAEKPTTMTVLRERPLARSLARPPLSLLLIAKNHRSRGAARTFSIVVDRPPEIGLMERRPRSVDRTKKAGRNLYNGL